MKLPKYEGPDLQEAKAQFTALHKEAEALVATSQKRMAEIEVRGVVGVVRHDADLGCSCAFVLQPPRNLQPTRAGCALLRCRPRLPPSRRRRSVLPPPPSTMSWRRIRSWRRCVGADHEARQPPRRPRVARWLRGLRLRLGWS